jgi:hypothetical protein
MCQRKWERGMWVVDRIKLNAYTFGTRAPPSRLWMCQRKWERGMWVVDEEIAKTHQI